MGDFEIRYMSLFKSDKQCFPEQRYNLLNEVFITINVHVHDENGYELNEYEINDNQFKVIIEDIYLKLKTFI